MPWSGNSIHSERRPAHTADLVQAHLWVPCQWVHSSASSLPPSSFLDAASCQPRACAKCAVGRAHLLWTWVTALWLAGDHGPLWPCYLLSSFRLVNSLSFPVSPTQLFSPKRLSIFVSPIGFSKGSHTQYAFDNDLLLSYYFLIATICYTSIKDEVIS